MFFLSCSFTVAHDARCPMRCAIVIGVDRGRVGCLWRRRAMGIGRRRVVSDALRHCGLLVSGSCGGSLASLCRGDWWGARPVGCVWWRCAVGLGGWRVWLCWALLCRIMSCHVLPCRVASRCVMSCRVVSRHVMSGSFMSLTHLLSVLVDDKSCSLESLPRVYSSVVDKR